MAEPVNRFAVAAASSGEPVVNRFSTPEIDYSKIGEFDANNATEGQQWRLALGYLTTPDIESRADIIRKVLPGSRIERDPNNGRPIVHYKGEVGYIDKPGITLGGVLDSLAQIGKYIPAGKLAMAGGNLLTRMGLAGVVAAATSVAEDVGAMAQGSKQGISPERAAATGIAATAGQAAGELVVAPAIGWLSNKGQAVWKAIRGTPKAVTPQGTLSAIGRRLAEQAGLDPDQVTPELANQLESAARKATAAGLPDDQVSTAVERQALSQRFKVPLTKGELTDDYAQQSLEENLRKMDITTNAGQIMRAAEKESASKLRGADAESGFGFLQREIGAGADDLAESGQTVIRSTQDRAATAKEAYRVAYRTARELGASLDARAYKQFLQDAELVLKDSVDYDPNLYPQTAKVIDNLRGRLVFMEESGRAAPRKIPLAKLENMRKIINAQWKSADATDRMGLDVLRNQFDEMVNGAIDSGRVSGDETAVQAWKAGRDLYSRFQQLYGVSREAGRAEQSAGREIQNWLRSENVTGEEVIRKAVQNKGLTNRILEINGQGSPAHQSLKQGALEYVFRPAMKGEGMSPRLIVSQYEKFFEKSGKENMQAIFSAEDRKAITEFVKLARAKIPQEGVVNFSNSGNVLVKGAQQLLGKLGIIGAATGHVETAAALGAAGAITRGVRWGQAAKAVQGLTPAVRSAAMTATAAGIADQTASDND